MTKNAIGRSADARAVRAKLLERLEASFHARAERGLRSNDNGKGTDAIEQGSAQTKGQGAEEEQRFKSVEKAVRVRLQGLIGTFPEKFKEQHR